MSEVKDIIEYPDYKNFIGLLTDSYSGTKEVINPLKFFIPSKEKVDAFDKDLFAKQIFSGTRISLPYFKILDPHIEKFNRFEDYTKKNEVNNIATWILSAFQYLNIDSVRVGKELEIIQEKNPRDGRLDVAALKGVQTISIETKTDLKSLLNENRFISQISGYKKECSRLNKEHLSSSDALVLLSIGGDETDIYPPKHPECSTGKVGGISDLFYKKIRDNNIKFVSANALWVLVTYKFITDKEIDLFDLIFSLLNKEKSVGLLSAGLIIDNNGSLEIESIDL